MLGVAKSVYWQSWKSIRRCVVQWQTVEDSCIRLHHYLRTSSQRNLCLSPLRQPKVLQSKASIRWHHVGQCAGYDQQGKRCSGAWRRPIQRNIDRRRHSRNPKPLEVLRQREWNNGVGCGVRCRSNDDKRDCSPEALEARDMNFTVRTQPE